VTAPFATQLRSNRAPIELAQPGTDVGAGGAITIRVQAADVWETVRVVVSPDASIAEIKQRVVAELFPNQSVSDFVLKLRGWEMLDERESLASAGVVNGSILLLAIRRRRPVR
jgi:hypothetical protein